MVIDSINLVISALANVITMLFSLLPNSPFTWSSNIDTEWLNAINWIFPISTAVSHLELYTLAVGVYYFLRIALRWTKAASG